jgi:hypothetical protein
VHRTCTETSHPNRLEARAKSSLLVAAAPGAIGGVAFDRGRAVSPRVRIRVVDLNGPCADEDRCVDALRRDARVAVTLLAIEALGGRVRVAHGHAEASKPRAAASASAAWVRAEAIPRPVRCADGDVLTFGRLASMRHFAVVAHDIYVGIINIRTSSTPASLRRGDRASNSS